MNKYRVYCEGVYTANMTVPGQYMRCTETVNRANADMLYCPSAGPEMVQHWASTGAQYRPSTGMLYWPSAGVVSVLHWAFCKMSSLSLAIACTWVFPTSINDLQL